MKKIFVSTLAGAFLLVNVSSVAANTIDLGNERGRETLQDEDFMEGYQKRPMPKNAPELVAWLAASLLEKGIDWLRKKENQEKAKNACSCYSEWQDEGNQGVKGQPNQKYFGNSFNATDYDDDDEVDLTEEEISALDNFCY